MCKNEKSKYSDLLSKEAVRIPPDVGNPIDAPPEWLDLQLFRKGQLLYERYFFSMMMCMLSGLLCLLVVPNIVTVLVLTRRSHTPRKSFTRYFSTIRHLMIWFRGDPWDPNSSAHASITKVRHFHSIAQDKAERELGVRISQLEMVQTQWAFFGLGFLYPDKFGMRLSNSDSLAVAHFWRGIGYLMGIDDKYNICEATVEATRENCKVIIEDYMRPYMISPPPEAEPMSESLVKGMRRLVPTLSLPANQTLLAELLDLPKHCYPILTGRDKRFYYYQKNICRALLLLGWILHPFLNFFLWLGFMIWVRAANSSRVPTFGDMVKVTLSRLGIGETIPLK